MKIEVEGVKYTVVENLGYRGGYYAKIVKTPNGDRVVVKKGGWVFWKPIIELFGNLL